MVEVEQDGDDERGDQSARYIHPWHPAHVLRGDAHVSSQLPVSIQWQGWRALGILLVPRYAKSQWLALPPSARRAVFESTVKSALPGASPAGRGLSAAGLCLRQGRPGNTADLTPATVQVVFTFQVLGICTRRGRPPGEGLAIAYARPLHATTISGTP